MLRHTVLRNAARMCRAGLPTRYLSATREMTSLRLQRVAVRGYASSEGNLNRFAELSQKMQSSPQVLEALGEVQKLLVEKQYVKPGEPPSSFAMMKIFMDTEVREKLQQLKKALDDANIVISPEDVASMVQLLKLKE